MAASFILLLIFLIVLAIGYKTYNHVKDVKLQLFKVNLMTKNQLLEVLNQYKIDLDYINIKPVRHSQEFDIPHDPLDKNKVLEHSAWMIFQIQTMLSENSNNMEKIMRWYGFVQGALWSVGIYTIDRMRKDNTAPSKE